MKRTTILFAALGALFGLTHPTTSSADIVKCKSSSGQITYAQGSCPPGTSRKAFSRRAAEMEKQYSACIGARSRNCPAYDKTYKFCSDRKNWLAADCKALRELTEATLYLVDKQIAEGQQSHEQECQEGDQSECVKAGCGMYLTGPLQQIKKCAQLKGLAVGDTWAVTKDYGSGSLLVGRVKGNILDIVCFPLVNFRNPIGMQYAWHPTAQVNEYIPPDEEAKTYFVQHRKFSTLDAAAVEACADSAAKMETTN